MNLYQFANEAAYMAAKPNLTKPAVSLLLDSMETRFDSINSYTYVPKILYSDLTKSVTFDPTKTPIGILVIPANHRQDNKEVFMSLVNMSLTDPENGTYAEGNDSSTNPGAGIKWGNRVQVNTLVEGDFPGLTYDDEQKDYRVNDHVVSANGYYYPTDVEMLAVDYPFFKGVHYMRGNAGYGPYPFNRDGSQNTIYASPTFSYLEDGNDEPTLCNNVVSHMDGATKTAGIIAAAVNTETTGSISNSSEAGHFPAAMACHRFTAGVASLAGQWYMPEIGELGYVMANLNAINIMLNIMRAAGKAAVAVGDIHTQDTLGGYLWSSSESSSGSARRLDTYSGSLSDNYDRANSNTSYRVRSFIAL